MSTLLELAERCERATGPDHALDAHIHVALCGYTIHEDTDPAKGHFAFWDGEPWESICSNCSSWSALTASIDEALTLVDPKAQWAVGSMEEGPFARLCWPMPNGSYVGGYVEASAATVPLAICAAALRARASLSQSASPHNGEAPITTAIEVGCGGKEGE